MTNKSGSVSVWNRVFMFAEGAIFFAAVFGMVAPNAFADTGTTTPLGNQIVCFVFNNLGNVGSPIPPLGDGTCPSGSTSGGSGTGGGNSGGGGDNGGGGNSGGGSTGGAGGGSNSDLSLTKSVDVGALEPGSDVTYTLMVENAGPDLATGVVVVDSLPSGLIYLSDDGGGHYVPGTGIWSAGTIDVGSEAVLHITAELATSTTPGTSVTNTASITHSDSNDGNTSNNTSSASVSVSVTSDAGSAPSDGGDSSGGADTSSSSGSSAASPAGGNVISGPLSPGYVNGGGEVLGTSTENSACGTYLSAYLRMGRKNDTSEVSKLQQFLNQNLGLKLPVTGFFGPLTYAAVEKFQLKYNGDVLDPWMPYGLGKNTPTGYVFKTTQREINNLMCATLNLPIPALP